MTTTHTEGPVARRETVTGGTFPPGIRRVLGPLAAPAMLLCLLATGPLEPFPDENAEPAVKIAELAGHVGQVQLMSLLELLAAVLMGGVVLFYAGATRRRGRGVGNAAAVIGVLGVVGMTFIGLHHLVLVALAGQPTPVGVAVLDALDHAATPAVFLLFFAGPIALLLFAIAGFRAGFVPLPALALMVLFFIGELVPSLPQGELIPLVVALIAAVWVAVSVQRAPHPGTD